MRLRLRGGLSGWALAAFLPLSTQAATHHLSIELDPAAAHYSRQQDGQVAAVWRVPIAPLSVAAVGDVVVLDVSFANGALLELRNRTSSVEPNLQIERLQYQFLGPLGGTTATRSASTFALLGQTGQLLQHNPAGPFVTTFTCGNCLSGFTSGDLTDKRLRLKGVVIIASIEEVIPAGGFTEFYFSAFAGNVRTRH